MFLNLISTKIDSIAVITIVYVKSFILAAGEDSSNVITNALNDLQKEPETTRIGAVQSLVSDVGSETYKLAMTAAIISCSIAFISALALFAFTTNGPKMEEHKSRIIRTIIAVILIASTVSGFGFFAGIGLHLFG